MESVFALFAFPHFTEYSHPDTDENRIEKRNRSNPSMRIKLI